MANISKLPDLAFIDVETTGLDFTKHRVIEIAAARVNLASNPHLWADTPVIQSFKIKPNESALIDAEPIALQVNGYKDNAKDWDSAPEMGSADAAAVWRQIWEVCRYASLATQNVPFDKGFAIAEFKYHGIVNVEPWARRFCDIQSYSIAIALEYGLTKWGLSDVYAALVKYEGYEPIPTHRAAGDVLAGYRITRRALRKLVPAPKGGVQEGR